MEQLKFPLLILGTVLLHLLIYWLSRKGNGGKLGQKIRSSNYGAWQSAVKDKEEELERLKSAKPPD